MDTASSIRTDILSLLQEGPRSAAWLFEHCHRAENRKQVSNALYQLKQRGDVELLESGNGQPSRLYRLTEHVKPKDHPWRQHGALARPENKPAERPAESAPTPAQPEHAPSEGGAPMPSFGWWSDGTLEIRTDEAHLSLAPSQARAFIDFLVGVRPGLHEVLGRPTEIES